MLNGPAVRQTCVSLSRRKKSASQTCETPTIKSRWLFTAIGETPRRRVGVIRNKHAFIIVEFVEEQHGFCLAVSAASLRETFPAGKGVGEDSSMVFVCFETLTLSLSLAPSQHPPPPPFPFLLLLFHSGSLEATRASLTAFDETA